MRNASRRTHRGSDSMTDAMFEALEPRKLLSGFSWTAEEVLLLELVNRARANPMAEATLLGLDLTDELTAAEIARLVPQEPLSLNEELTLAARLHSLDMAERDFFDHVNPDGDSPTDRAGAQGYAGTAGENIAAGFTSIESVHRAWLDSVGHRRNVLSLHTNFSDNFHYDQFGAGVAHTDIGPFFDYHTQKFGYPGTSGNTYLTGVVINDGDGDFFYDIGEGVGGVRVDAALIQTPGDIVGTYTTGEAGNFQMALGQGVYLITFTDLATGDVSTGQIVIGTDNAKIDGFLADFVDPSSGQPTTPDDHANYLDFINATNIDVTIAGGGGASGGVIDGANDTDLFRFTAPATGEITINFLSAETIGGTLAFFDTDGNRIGSGAGSTQDLVESTFSLNVVEGRDYFIRLGSTQDATGSTYALLLQFSEFAQSSFGLPDDDVSLTGTGNADGGVTLTVLDENGRPTVLRQDANGDWERIDLLAVAGGPGVSEDVVTWKGSGDQTFAAAPSEAGFIVFREEADGWVFRNLTEEIDGASNIASKLTVFTSIHGQVHVAGRTDAGDLVFYQQTGDSLIDGRAEWVFRNISQDDLRANGHAVPEFVGDTTSYVTPWNGLNIVGLDASGNIQVVWWAPGLDSWVSSDLSAVTGAPALSGGLTVYLTPWSGINIAGVDLDGKLSVTWWVPSFGGDWLTTNLTNAYSGPILEASSVASYVTSWGGLNVAGLDSNGDVVVYWWAPGLDTWYVANLSNLVDAPIAGGSLTGVTVSATGDINVFATTDDDQLIRLVWEVGGDWQIEMVTDLLA